jgi:hypothetical protein
MYPFPKQIGEAKQLNYVLINLNNHKKEDGGSLSFLRRLINYFFFFLKKKTRMTLISKL